MPFVHAPEGGVSMAAWEVLYVVIIVAAVLRLWWGYCLNMDITGILEGLSERARVLMMFFGILGLLASFPLVSLWLLGVLISVQAPLIVVCISVAATGASYWGMHCLATERLGVH